MNNYTGIRWTSNTKYVDIDTGEEIQKRTKEETRQEIAKKYIIIKTNRYARTNEIKTRGHIEYIVECKRKPEQLSISYP